MTIQENNTNSTNNNQVPPAPNTGDNLQTISQDDNVQAGSASDDGAAGSSAEDTLAELFRQSQAQVAQLVEQNKSLQDQIGMLLRNGASVTDTNGMSTPNNDNTQKIGNMTQLQFEYKQSENYVSLADLGREAGKRDYENHNLEK